MPFDPTITPAAQLWQRDEWDDAGESNNPGCTTTVPGPNGNVPMDACNSNYNYGLAFAPAVAVAVIFGVLTGLHVVEAVIFRKGRSTLARETAAFILHALGSRGQQQIAYATAWQLLFLLAPLWINASAYHDVRAGGVLIPARADRSAGSGPRPSRGTSCGPTCSRSSSRGVGGIMARAWSVSSNYWFAGFAGGISPSNPIPFYEEYSYALDCFPMMLCLLVLAIWNPGRYLIGPEAEFPRETHAEKKAEKLERKGAKRQRKEEKKARKKAGPGAYKHVNSDSIEFAEDDEYHKSGGYSHAYAGKY